MPPLSLPQLRGLAARGRPLTGRNGASTLPYRPCVGVMMLNADGKVFAAQRIDATQPAWQMPQGGIDPGEEPLNAALRELEEETGVSPAKVEMLAQTERWLNYDLPPDVASRIWNGQFRGQSQKWFLVRYVGSDADIDIATHSPEFSQWAWVDAEALVAGIVPFKRAVYAQVAEAFRPWLSGDVTDCDAPAGGDVPPSDGGHSAG